VHRPLPRGRPCARPPLRQLQQRARLLRRRPRAHAQRGSLSRAQPASAEARRARDAGAEAGGAGVGRHCARHQARSSAARSQCASSAAAA
jgi:hypothetical protein